MKTSDPPSGTRRFSASARRVAAMVPAFLLGFAATASAGPPAGVNPVPRQAQAQSPARAEGPAKNRLVDRGDYYILNTGERATFLRQEGVYLVLHDRRGPAARQLSAAARAQAGPLVEEIRDHRFPGAMVRIKDLARSGAAIAALRRADASITDVAPMLKSRRGPGDLALPAEIVVRLAADAKRTEAVATLDALGLELVRKLRLTDREFRFRIRGEVSEAGEIFALTRAAARLPLVEWAEPNFLAAPLRHFTPDDTFYPDQWHLNNTGQNDIVADADIDAPEGWDTARGDGSIIAVIDDGVDLAHEDLNIWSNPGETGGGKETNGVDDDGNGFIDDYQGWDFAGASQSPDLLPGDNDPSPHFTDDNHGTAVAGVAGAVGNNALGVTGGATGATILPVRTGYMLCSDYGEAMRYGAKYADVVNNSWSISGCESDLNSAISDAVNGTIAGARRGTKGTPVLFAAGNQAGGWLRLWAGPFTPGSHDYHWKFLKDATVSEGHDTVWLDEVRWPGDAVTDFESDTPGGVPAGFTSEGNGNWTVVSHGGATPDQAWGATGNAVRAGAITDSQSTSLKRTYSHAAGSNYIYFWVWVSSQYEADWFEFYVDEGVDPQPLWWQWTPGQYGVHDNDVGYPANNADTIAIGGSTDGHTLVPGQARGEIRSYYSQHGTDLDVVAPTSGGYNGITTTDRTGAAGYNDGVVSDLADTNYTDGFGGTSSATPLASGVVAALIEECPNITAAQVRQALRDGAAEIGPYPYASGRNDYYGYGRLDLPGTLAAAFCRVPSLGWLLLLLLN